MSFLFDLPFISSIFFILAGILIGHLLWFHDRSVDSQKMTGLESRYFKARGSARQRKREFVNLKKSAAKQESALADTQTQLLILRNKNSDLESAALEAGDEIKRLRREQESVVKKFADEESRSESLVAQLQEVLQQKTVLEKDAQSRQSTHAQLQASHQELEAEIQRLRASMDNHAQTIASDRSEISDLRSELGKRDEQVQFAGRQQQNLELEIAELKQLLEAKDASAGQRLSGYESTITQLQSEVSRLETEIDGLNQSLKDTQSDLVARCEDLDGLRDQRDVVAQKLDTMSAQNDTVVAERDAAVAERDALSVDLEAAANSLAQQRQLLDSREEEVDQFKGEIGSYQEKYEATQQQLIESRRDIDALQKSIAELNAEKDSMQTTIAQLSQVRDQLDESEQQLLTLNQTIQQLDAEKQSQQSTIEMLMPLKEQLSDSQRQAESLQSQIEQLEPLRDELSEIEKVLTEAKTANQQNAQQIESQANTIEEKDSEIVSLTKQLEQLDVLQQSLSEANQHSGSLKDENQRLQVVLREREAVLQQNQSQIEEWERSYQDLQTTLQEKEQFSIDQQKQIETLNTETAAMQNDLQKQTSRVAELQKRVEVKSAQYDKSLGEISGLTQSLNEQRESLTKLTADLADAEELRPKNELLLSRIDELMAHLKRVNSEHEDSLEANAAALDRIRDLETDLHSQAAKIRELRRERGSIRDLDAGEGEIRRAA